MKKSLLCLLVLMFSTFAVADGRSVNVGVNQENGDLAITIYDEAAEKLYLNLAVVPRPGLGHETLMTMHKRAENILCSAFYHDTTLFDPENGRKWTTYSCQIGLDKSGRAYSSK